MTSIVGKDITAWHNVTKRQTLMIREVREAQRTLQAATTLLIHYLYMRKNVHTTRCTDTLSLNNLHAAPLVHEKRMRSCMHQVETTPCIKERNRAVKCHPDM